MWVVYILKCSDNTLYTGITNNIEKRMLAHNSGKGAKYTKSRGPFVIVYMLEMFNRIEASKEEYRIKQLSREQKLKLIKEK